MRFFVFVCFHLLIIDLFCMSKRLGFISSNFCHGNVGNLVQTVRFPDPTVPSSLPKKCHGITHVLKVLEGEIRQGVQIRCLMLGACGSVEGVLRVCLTEKKERQQNTSSQESLSMSYLQISFDQPGTWLYSAPRLTLSQQGLKCFWRAL